MEASGQSDFSAAFFFGNEPLVPFTRTTKPVCLYLTDKTFPASVRKSDFGRLVRKQSHYCCKSKAISLQAWTGSEGSRRMRIPDFKTIGT